MGIIITKLSEDYYLEKDLELTAIATVSRRNFQALNKLYE